MKEVENRGQSLENTGNELSNLVGCFSAMLFSTES